MTSSDLDPVEIHRTIDALERIADSLERLTEIAEMWRAATGLRGSALAWEKTVRAERAAEKGGVTGQ